MVLTLQKGDSTNKVTIFLTNAAVLINSNETEESTQTRNATGVGKSARNNTPSAFEIVRQSAINFYEESSAN